jgi:hypothetical protein
MIPITRFAVATVCLCALNTSLADIRVVDRPVLTGTNLFYVGNRQPLAPSQFIQLPAGSIEPRGWLKAFLERQREGLTGHLGEISAWLQKEDNAWLSKDGKGKWGWEELPYWLKGYIDLAYIFNDPKMIKECDTWIEGALASQRPNGDFGPDQRLEDGTRDYWANMIMLFCLQSYYEHSHDPRVLDLMSRYFKYQLGVPDNQLLTGYWQKMRGGDNLYSVYWLYNLTGDPQLLEVARKIHRCTANWKLNDNLPNWHNVNIAQCFREPAEYFLQTHDGTDLQAAYANFREVRKRYGQVPGGMFGSDENCRPGYDDPHQAVETCGMVEQMLSDEMLMRISGDAFWGDQCEEVAFNTYPAATMPDFKALRYLTAPNMVVSDGKNHSPGIENGGPFLMMNPFSSRCCQHNHSHGWPYFNKNLWMATPDNGVCAAMYSASEVRVRVGDGTQVRIAEETHYPFEDRIQFTLAADKPVSFPLYLRIPAWCKAAQVMINSKPVKVVATPGSYVRVEREWKNRDVITLDLPMEISVRHWNHNHDSVSVDYGPLTFSLKIGERYDRFDSTRTAIGDSSWQKGADPSQWPSFEIHPTTPWNYGLILDEPPAKAFKIKKGEWPKNDFPFTIESAPIQLEAKAKRIPEWTLDRHELCAVLQASPVLSDEPVETVSLIPMGSARLRISAFPVVGSGPTAHRWVAPEVPKQPLYKASASHVFDDLSAPCDEVAPASSNDQSISRFTWWDHRGTAEWFQYDFQQPKQISEVSVYWFDDTGTGQCRVPVSWRLLYQDGEAWKPVMASDGFGTKRDDWNRVLITPVNTTALRLEVQLQPSFSGGILEWRVK